MDRVKKTNPRTVPAHDITCKIRLLEAIVVSLYIYIFFFVCVEFQFLMGLVEKA